VLIFDFVDELYVWCGTRADSELKRIGCELAEELYKSDDYEPDGKSKRSKWCLFKKVVQNMEPIIFIEKFHDWPQPVELRSSEIDGIKLKLGATPLFDTSWLKTYDVRKHFFNNFFN